MTEAVLFAYNAGLHTSKLLPGRPELFDMLTERGLSPVVSEGAEHAFHGTEVDAEELTRQNGVEAARALGSLTLHNEIKVIVNRADRSLKLTDMPPMINENATRSLGHRKWDSQRKVLDPLGIGIPTTLITSGEDIDAFLTAHAAPKMIAKPQIGTFGKNVERLARDTVPERFAENPKWRNNYLLQPAYDVTIPLPSAIRPYDTAAREAFETGNQKDIRKELRMYGFYGHGQAEVFPVGRAFKDGKDHWFFVDPDTVPEEVHDGAKAAVTKAAEVSGAMAVLGATDYIYGSAAGEDPAWGVVELNLRTPYLVGYEHHAGAANRLHTMFADQIARTARPV